MLYQFALEDLSMNESSGLCAPTPFTVQVTRAAALERYLQWAVNDRVLSRKTALYGVCFQKDQPSLGPSPLVVAMTEGWYQALTASSFLLVETQLCHPTKDIIWEVFLGMCNCAENVFVLQTRGNGVAICWIYNNNKHNSMDISFFPLWVWVVKYLSFGLVCFGWGKMSRSLVREITLSISQC